MIAHSPLPKQPLKSVTVSIRPAMPEDEAFLLKLYATTREDELALTGWDDAAKDAFVRMQYHAQQTHYSLHYTGVLHNIVSIGDESVGMTWVAALADEIRLMDMAVLPEWRNCGIGSQLVKRVLAQAAAMHVPVSLHVWLGNPRAARLYARLGFVPVHDDGAYMRMEWRPTSALPV